MEVEVSHGETVGVLGAGTMGQGIAQVCAAHGHTVRLFDAAPGKAAAAVRGVCELFEKLSAKGKMTPEAVIAAKGRLSAEEQLAAMARGATCVIEAVPENMDLKVSLFRELLPLVGESTLLASNTSSLSLTELGARVGAASRTIGLHFFNPPGMMELLEVVRGLETGEGTIQRAQAFARSIGKTTILVRDVPGFATSRLGVILGAEAIRMLETGVARAEDIDRGMELGYKHPMGPLKLTDLVGLDVRLSILEHLQRELGEQFRPPALLRTMVRAGKLGKKTGEGFYVWKDGSPQPKEGVVP